MPKKRRKNQTNGSLPFRCDPLGCERTTRGLCFLHHTTERGSPPENDPKTTSETGNRVHKQNDPEGIAWETAQAKQQRPTKTAVTYESTTTRKKEGEQHEGQ